MSLPFRIIVAGLTLSAGSYAAAANLLSVGPTAEALSDSMRARQMEEGATVMSRFADEQKLVGEGDTYIHGQGRYGAHMSILLSRKNGNFYAVKEFIANPDGSVREVAYQLPEDAGPGQIALNGLTLREGGTPATKIFRYYTPSWGPKVHTSESYNVMAVGDRKLRVLESRNNQFGELEIRRPFLSYEQTVNVRFTYLRYPSQFKLSKAGLTGNIVDAKMQADHLILTVFNPVDESFKNVDVPFKEGEFKYDQIQQTALSTEDVRKLRIYAESKTIPGRAPVPVDNAAPAGMTVDSAPNATGTAQ